MNAIKISTMMFMLLAAAATVQANPGMGGPSSPPAPAGKNRPVAPMPPGYAGPGVTNCYDYAYACGTGRRPTGRMYGPKNLENDPSVKRIDNFGNPLDARGRYRPGDWIVTNDGHSGYVNSHGGIDHYHQFSDGGKYRSGQRYLNPNNLNGWRDGQGGLRTNDSLDAFIHSGDTLHPWRTRPPGGIKVLRR